MIRPTKHAHPDQTVISASLTLLRRLKQRRLEEFDSLRAHLKKSIAGGEVLFLPALDLLFLLGLIEYRPKNDSLEYVGPNGTV